MHFLANTDFILPHLVSRRFMAKNTLTSSAAQLSRYLFMKDFSRSETSFSHLEVCWAFSRKQYLLADSNYATRFASSWPADLTVHPARCVLQIQVLSAKTKIMVLLVVRANGRGQGVGRYIIIITVSLQ